MTSLVDPVSVIGEPKSVILASRVSKQHHKLRNVLKSKEDTYRPKCNKVLKRKLKKYKLRQGGKEDQDILDVSEILLSSLSIKSPNNESFASVNSKCKAEDRTPKNYLFNMVRRKQSIKILGNCESKEVKELHEDEVGLISEKEKKQTNAFELLMDSRNKSLGSNSPGKEKLNEDFELQEIIDSKNIKAKRRLMLQKMAEAKGSIEKQEMDDYHEKIVKRKMDRRAEKLKSMILKKEVKLTKKDKSSSQMFSSPLDNNKSLKTNRDVVEKPLKTSQLVNFSNAAVTKTNNIISEKAHLLREDEEFLKKLSPSIRKKESMLCYLKKIDKASNCAPAESENDTHIIKVKLTSKTRKKCRKPKLSLNKDNIDSYDISFVHKEDISNKVVTLECLNVISNGGSEGLIVTGIGEREGLNVTSNINCYDDRRKRKRDFKDSRSSCNAVCSGDYTTNNDEVRPKRNMKKPIKYSDDANISSSDEELHIFTPKKKKHLEDKSNPRPITKLKVNKYTDNSKKLSNIKNKGTKEINQQKKPLKLAPIFATKMRLDTAAVEAKQKFLQSGVPDQLKKVITKKKDKNILITSFPKVVHVQQIETVEISALIQPFFNLHTICPDDIHSILLESNLFDKLLNLSTSHHTGNIEPIHSKNALMVLENIKRTRPKFPVYRTYRLLRDKKKGNFKTFNYLNLDNSVEILNGVTDINNENPDQLIWTDKYKGMSTDQIIGNFESIKEIRKWLVSWTENELNVKSKNNNPVDSDSSDCYQSDGDSSDSGKTANNLLIVTGPVGSGKTSSVYAVASELAIKVIEVNASSKRTGKIMLQDLQEATRSHKVNRGAGSSDCSQKSQEIIESSRSMAKKVLKRGRPKKVVEDMIQPLKIAEKQSNGLSESQENFRTEMSLILVDDVDIVFDQDDGFCSALVQLVYSSKRPVIMVTTSLTSPHLQRFLQCSKLIRMQPLLPRMLGTWLDIMCLADSGLCWPGAGAKFLNYFKGDMRKTINCLQFYVSTQEHLCSVDEESDSKIVDCLKSNIDEENSTMSWADREAIEDRSTNDKTLLRHNLNSIWNIFINEQLHLLHFKYPLELFNIWWSIPYLLNAASDLNGETNDELIVERKPKSKIEMRAFCNAIDTLSVSDYLTHGKPVQKINIASKLWYNFESHSVSEQEDLDNFVKNYEISDEISHELIKSSIVIAQKALGCDGKTDIHFPDMTIQRERDRMISRHKNLTTYLNQSAVLDRRAIALDYWPSCRTICRIEKSKTDKNSKRNNRFCHYLKSLSVLCKSDSFDNLGNSLCPGENN